MPSELDRNERRRETLRLLSTYLDDMPVLPGVAASLLRCEGRDRALAERAETLSRLDPTLAFRMCFLARGMLCGSAPRFLTTQSVLARVGTDRLVEGLSSVLSRKTFRPQELRAHELWLHSIQVALAAQHFSTQLTHRYVNSDEAYFFGLLHDIGRFVMLGSAPDKFAALELTDWETGDDLVAAERAILGFDHAELGGLACEKWRLPPSLAAVVRYHHRDGVITMDGKPAPDLMPLVHLVRLADAVSFMMVKFPDMVHADPMSAEILLEQQGARQAAQHLGISLASVIHAVPALHQRSVELAGELFDGVPAREEDRTQLDRALA